MALAAGQQIAHYRLIEKIGAGGMGEVYVAEDTRLKRQVAIKILPDWLAKDPAARARFEREAQAVAALNHPHIVTIHSVEEAGGIRFLTMEHIQGRRLTERIPRGGMALRDILKVAIPLADAVASAHDRRITHRDLKPDNVMITAGGEVKVLDFGLAKLRDPAEDSGDATQAATAALTAEGKIVGTAAYMSPEQAEGKAVDVASDVFSLGVILYEMATGDRPFKGETPISTISSILRDTPPLIHERNRAMPRHLGRIVKRCLRKDPERRYASARGLRNDLEALLEELESGDLSTGPAGAATSAPDRSRAPLIAMAAALIVVSALALSLWLRPSSSSAGDGGETAHVTVSQQTLAAGLESWPSLSPDGQFLAYSADGPGDQRDIFLERVGGRNPINLTADSPANDLHPAFSPDGSLIAFSSDRDGGGIYLMGATGEAVRRLTDTGSNPAWSPDGRKIVYATEGVFNPNSRSSFSALWAVEVESGKTTKIYEGDAVQPAWSPGGDRIAFWTVYDGGGARGGQRDIATIRADGTDEVFLTNDPPLDWNPVWSADGRHIWFASDRGGSMNLWRIAVDESGRAQGAPRPVTMPSGYSAPFALASSAPILAYSALDTRANIEAIGFDPATARTTGSVRQVTRGTLPIRGLSASPDGEWILFDTAGTQEDLYLVRSDGTGMRKLTDDAHKDRGPTWHPDGDRIVFYSNRGGNYDVWTLRRDGSNLRQITAFTGRSLWFPHVSPDGRMMTMFNREDGGYLFEFGGEALLRIEDGKRLGGDDGPPVIPRLWAPDNRRIAAQREGVLGIYDVSTGSFDPVSTPEGAPLERVAGWLPDGSLLAYAGETAYIVTAGTRTRATEVHGPDRFVVAETADRWAVGFSGGSLSPDGRTLYYLNRSSEADIWIARLE